MKLPILFFIGSALGAANHPTFSSINKKYSNLHEAQIRCAIDMTNDSQTSLQTESHLVLFGKNTARVLTWPEKPSARLLSSLLHNLAPVMLRNILPDTMDRAFRWQGANLVRQYQYQGAPSENTYIFSHGSRLDAIEIRTSDRIMRVKMEFTWELAGGTYRLARLINNQLDQEAKWEMQVTYGKLQLAGFSVPTRIFLTLHKGGRTMKHALRFSDCTLN